MRITRLRLTGFKSFVEPSDFVIEPGLTAVVGPNGCGKSNLAAALADLTARRNQLQATIREHSERWEKLRVELINIEAELAATGSDEPDLPALGAQRGSGAH